MSRQEFFHFFPDDSKQDSATTYEHSKLIIEMLQNRTVLFSDMSTVCENTDVCADQYCFTTALYLLLIFSHAYNIIIDRGGVAPEHGIEVVDDFNSTDKNILSVLTTTVKIPGTEDYDSQTEMNTSTENKDISLAREFQKYLSDPTRSHVLLYHGKYRKRSIKRKWTYREYNVQYSKDLSQILVKISWELTKLPALYFFSLHAKPHGVRGLSKHHHLRLDPKLGHGNVQ